MGYTNYIKNKPAFTAKQWDTFRKRCKEIFANSKVPLSNWDSDSGKKPEISLDRVSFNGVGEDGHESCVIKQAASEFEFCKTAQKPYDAVVILIYKLVKEILPSTELSSDGGDEVFSD